MLKKNFKIEKKHMNKHKIGEKWSIDKILKNHLKSICSLSIDPSENILATGSLDGKIYLWDLSKLVSSSSLIDESNEIYSLTFGDSCNSILSGGKKSFITEWNIHYSSIMRKYHGHTGNVTKLTKCPFLNLLMSGSMDGNIKLWDFRVHKEITTLHGHESRIISLLHNKETSHITSGSSDGCIKFWDLIANKNLLTIKKKNQIKEMIASTDQENFFTLNEKSIEIYRKDGMFIKNIKNIKNSNKCFAINKNNLFILGHLTGCMSCGRFRDENCFFSFKPFVNIFIKKCKLKHFIIRFDEKRNRIITCVQKNIKIFSKKWFPIN